MPCEGRQTVRAVGGADGSLMFHQAASQVRCSLKPSGSPGGERRIQVSAGFCTRFLPFFLSFTVEAFLPPNQRREEEKAADHPGAMDGVEVETRAKQTDGENGNWTAVEGGGKRGSRV